MPARLLAAAAALALAAAAPAADWDTFRTRDHGYAVRLPADPEITSKVNGTGDQRVRSTTAKCVADGRLYMILSLRPLGPTPPAGTLDSAYRGYKQDQLKQDAVEVIEEGKVKAGATDGRTLVVKRSSGLYQLNHVYVHDNRLHVVCLVAKTKAELSDESAKTFLGSVRFEAAGK